MGLTCAGRSGKSGELAGGGEGEGFGDIEVDSQLGTALEGLAEALSVGANHGLEPRAATLLRLHRGAPIGHEGQAVRHLQYEG